MLQALVGDLRLQEGQRVDGVFGALLGGIVEQVDVSFRVTPLLVEAFEGLELGPPREGRQQLRDALSGVLRDVVSLHAEDFVDLPVAEIVKAVDAEDFERAAALLEGGVPPKDEDEDDVESDARWSSSEWRAIARRSLARAARQAAEAARFGAFYSSPEDFGAAASAIAAIGAGSFEDMMSARGMMAAMMQGSGTYARAAGNTGLAVVQLVESDERRAIATVRAALKVACSLARIEGGNAPGGAPVRLDIRSRVLLVLQAAGEARDLDHVFSTLLCETLERSDVGVPLAPLARDALAGVVLAPGRAEPDSFDDAARLVWALLVQQCPELDQAAGAPVRACDHEAAHAALTAWATRTSDMPFVAYEPNAEALRASESAWTRETWLAMAASSFATAFKQGAATKRAAAEAGSDGARWFTFVVTDLARTVGCLARAAGPAGPSILHDALVAIRALARAGSQGNGRTAGLSGEEQ